VVEVMARAGDGSRVCASSFIFTNRPGRIRSDYSTGILDFQARFTAIDGSPMYFNATGLAIIVPNNLIGASTITADAFNTAFALTQAQINDGRISTLPQLYNGFLQNSRKMLQILAGRLAPHNSGFQTLIQQTSRPTNSISPFVPSWQMDYGTIFRRMTVNSSLNPCQ
jgi:hypothetical protein